MGIDLNLSSMSLDVLALNPELTKLTIKKPSKYRNVRTSMDGMSFDSGKEAADAQKFVLGIRAGEWIAYLHHVRVTLPGNIKMELDHVLINNQFECEIFDSKGSDAIQTRDWKNKAKLFEATYGKKIKII